MSLRANTISRENFVSEMDRVNEKLRLILRGNSPPAALGSLSDEQAGEQHSDATASTGEQELESLRRDYTELTEYLNKLEAGYNQSLEYIGHLEEIIALCAQCRKARDALLNLFFC